MASPPFEVESHLNQNIQAADWIAAIIGKLWTFRLGGTEWSDIEHYERYFWGRVHALATHSTVMERQKKQTTKIEKETTSAVITMHAGETAIAAAFQKATFKKTSKYYRQAVPQLEIRISLVRFFGPTASSRTRANGPIKVAQPTQA